MKLFRQYVRKHEVLLHRSRGDWGECITELPPLQSKWIRCVNIVRLQWTVIKVDGWRWPIITVGLKRNVFNFCALGRITWLHDVVKNTCSKARRLDNYLTLYGDFAWPEDVDWPNERSYVLIYLKYFSFNCQINFMVFHQHHALKSNDFWRLVFKYSFYPHDFLVE